MSDLTKRQNQCITALENLLDRCHRNGLVLNVMEGEVYLGTQNRMDENGGLVQEDQHHVRSDIVADGGGW